MKFKTLLFSLLILSIATSPAAAEKGGPTPVSPAGEMGIASVAENCPTFSWTAVGGAEVYRVEVFPAPDGADLSHDDISLLYRPVLIKEIRGAATSWTPGAEESLSNGGRYTWYVQAIDGLGNGTWSSGASFDVRISRWSADLDVIVGEALEQHGVSTELIPGVLKGLRDRANNPAPEDPDSPTSSWGLPGFSIQGVETSALTAYGVGAGSSITSGLENTLLGFYAGNSTNTGHYNTSVGSNAGRYITSGQYNTSIGYVAGVDTTTANYNTFIGGGSGRYNTTGHSNTFLGMQTGYNNLSGYENIFIGFNSGVGTPTGGATGYQNICIGNHSGSSISATYGNIFLGYRAGYNETGSNKLYIENSDSSDPLIWGDFSTDVVNINGKLGVGQTTPTWPVEVKTAGSNAVILCEYEGGAINYINAIPNYGNFGVVNNYPLRLVVNSLWRLRLDPDGSLTMRNGATCTAAGVWTNASSRDLKENIRSISTEEAVKALDALDPVKYNYKTDQQDEYVGFIAEDVPELVASKDRKGMSSMDVVAVLTKVLKEQQKVVTDLQKTKAELEKRISELEKKQK